jgi:hypothetical protein
MLEINIHGVQAPKVSMRPEDMLNTPHGTVFQLMDNESSSDTYFISCGLHEKRVVVLWFEEEEGCWRLSTENKKDLRGYLDHITVREINATVCIDLKHGGR